MNIKLLLNIAKTHLKTRKKQTIVASLGVMFGIGSYVIMLSYMSGLNDLLDGLVLNRTPHVHIYNEVSPTENQPSQTDSNVAFVNSIKPKNEQERIHNALPLINHFRTQKGVRGVTPMVKVGGFYVAGKTQLNASIIGVEPLQEADLYNFNDYILNGNAMALAQQRNGIVLGKGVAKKLSLEVGDIIQIGTVEGTRFQLKIVGLYQSGLGEIDNIQSYVNLKIAQQMRGAQDNFITDINIKLFDLNNAPRKAALIRKSYDINAVDIQTANAQYETGSSIRTLISYAVSITLLVVAGFGIYNILNMLIYQKMNDIAILKATGFSGRDVQLIFIFQAIIIGIMGGILGLIVGYSVSVLIDNAPFETEALPTITTMPMRYDPNYYIIGFTFSMISTFLAGYLPSKKAQHIDPVEIIRGQ
jgi:lipoprotein-releasing system permease protein